MAHNSLWERNMQAICKQFNVYIHLIAIKLTRVPLLLGTMPSERGISGDLVPPALKDYLACLNIPRK